MKKILWATIIAALTLANIWMARDPAIMLIHLAELRTEKEQLAGEIAGMEDELKKLQASHSYYIEVSADISNRLAVVEGRAGP